MKKLVFLEEDRGTFLGFYENILESRRDIETKFLINVSKWNLLRRRSRQDDPHEVSEVKNRSITRKEPVVLN